MRVVVLDIVSGAHVATLESASVPRQEELLELKEGKARIVSGVVWREYGPAELEAVLHTRSVDFSGFFVPSETALAEA